MTNKDWTKDFGDNLASMINNAGFTQGKFAEAIGVNPSNVSRYINKSQMPGSKVMDRICNVLKCSFDDIKNYNKK